MNIQFALTKENMLIVIIDGHDVMLSNVVKSISFYEYIKYGDNLSLAVVKNEVELKEYSVKDLYNVYDSLEQVKNDLWMTPPVKTAFDLVNEFLDTGEGCLSHTFPNKDKVSLYLKDGMYFVNNKKQKIRCIWLSSFEYSEKALIDSNGDTYHHLSHNGGVFLKPTDSINAVKLFEISKIIGSNFTFDFINENFFDNLINITTIKDIVDSKNN